MEKTTHLRDLLKNRYFFMRCSGTVPGQFIANAVREIKNVNIHTDLKASSLSQISISLAKRTTCSILRHVATDQFVLES